MRRLVRHLRELRKAREGSVMRQKVFHFFRAAFLGLIACYQAVQHGAPLCDCEVRNCVPIFSKNVVATLHVPDEILPDYLLKILPEEVLGLPPRDSGCSKVCSRPLALFCFLGFHLGL